MASLKKLNVSSNVNNGSKTSLFTFNVNNSVSNANANNGSQLQSIGKTNCNSLKKYFSNEPLYLTSWKMTIGLVSIVAYKREVKNGVNQ